MSMTIVLLLVLCLCSIASGVFVGIYRTRPLEGGRILKIFMFILWFILGVVGGFCIFLAALIFVQIAFDTPLFPIVG